MEIKPIEVIDFLAFLLGIAALIVAIIGIRDVRDQVRLLLTMERNRTFTKLLEKFSLEFVDATNEDLRPAIARLKHEYFLLARAVDKNVTLDSAMHETNHEVLSHAAQLVKAGYAQWKPEMDPQRAEEVLRNWKTEKMVSTMFGNKPPGA